MRGTLTRESSMGSRTLHARSGRRSLPSLGELLLVDDVVMGGRGLVGAVLELVRVADHLTKEGRERAELDALPRRREVHGLVDERAHEREVRLAAPPAELGEERVEAGFMLLLEIVEVRHVPRLPRPARRKRRL